MLRRVAGSLGIALFLVAITFVLYARTFANPDTPVFTVEHEIVISAPADAVWRALMDFDAYPEWNPYALAIEGEAVVGESISLTIVLDTWAEAATVHPTIVRLNPRRELAWRDTLLFAGLQDTHHLFELTRLPNGQTRLRQAEEFSGWLPAKVYGEAEISPIERAFRAMNEALVRRIVGESRAEAE